MELVLCSLGEATATLYHRNRDSQGFPALKRDAHDAGVTAGKARQVIEADLGESVVSPSNHLALPGPTGRTRRSPKRLSGTAQPAEPAAAAQPAAETQLQLFDDPDSEAAPSQESA
jgi:hypothetical protein